MTVNYAVAAQSVEKPRLKTTLVAKISKQKQSESDFRAPAGFIICSQVVLYRI